MSGDDVQGRMAATSGGGSLRSLRSSRRKGHCRGRSGAAGSGKILASRWSRCASRTGLWCGGAAELLTGGAGVPFAAELDVVVRLGFLVVARGEKGAGLGCRKRKRSWAGLG